ncbi:MAG: MBL fold metallo-hydrolase, partial [Miltoncostaeaceae bacterium]
LVLAGPRRIVLDLGSGSLSALARHMAPEDLDAVVISHLHPDHCVDLFGLHVRMQWGPGRGRVIPVHGPPALAARLAAFADGERWRPEDGLDLRPHPGGGGTVDLGDGVLLRHREVPHLPPTHAVRVEAGGRALVYGADCAPDDALVELAAGADVLVCECTFGADPVPAEVPHLPAEAAGSIARRAGVGRLLLTHMQLGHDRGRALAVAAEAFGGPVAWAEDGVEVVV